MSDTARLVIASTSGTTTTVPPVPIGKQPGRRSIGRGRPPLLHRFATLLRLGRIHAGRLDAEDNRVLLVLAVSLIVAFGAQVDLDAPTPADVPDTLPSAPAALGVPPAAAPTGGSMIDDPTSGGQITQITAHGLAAMRAEFGPTLRSSTCWSAHEWNPKSDHPKGRACDVYTSPAGQFAAGEGLDSGNRVVAWLRQYAEPLDVSYVIWQCRIWSEEKGDRRYGGGGIYSCDDPVGGHWDHIHVSFGS